MNDTINRQPFREKLLSWKETLKKNNECGGCEAELMSKVISALETFPAADSPEGCDWCKPSKDGDYTMSLFKNPNNPEQEATLSVYGGQIVMELKISASTPPARMAVKISHCPMCGRRFEKAGEANE